METTNQVDRLLNQFQQANASDWLTKLNQLVWAYGPQILGAVVILVGGLWIARLLRGLIGKVLGRRQLDPIIASFIKNLAHIAMLAFVVIAALQTAGIPTTSPCKARSPILPPGFC